MANFHKALNLKKVTREAEYLEYVRAITKSGIEIRYFEDGLYILELKSSNIDKAQKTLIDYFNNIFNPAVSYIFSLGAPTPKVLANIESKHPTVVGITRKEPEKFKVNEKEFGEVYSQISSENITVFKTPSHIFMVTKPDYKKEMGDLIEMQIFFREFKDQLEKYLDIHRNIWEEISDIKERKTVKGKEIGKLRSRLDSNQKTIDLISSRINQMGSYVHTRSSLAKDLKAEKYLSRLFQYKFEVLINTHAYIKELWKMTKDYLSAAIQVMVELENQSTTLGIQTLQKITGVGVISGILGYLAGSKIPKVTFAGSIYFVLLIAATWGVNIIITKIHKNQRYEIKFTERAKKL